MGATATECKGDAMKMRVVLADDHPLFLQGVADTLRSEEDIDLLATATTHVEVQEACRQHQPDIVLLDLNMPGGTPFDTVSFLREHCPDTKVVVLSGFDDEAYVRGLVGQGITGYILKDELPETIVAALRHIMAGHSWFSPAISSRLLELATAPGQQGADAPTAREHEVLTLIAKGYTDQRIAQELGISESTVRYHITNLFNRTGVASRVELALYGVKQGWIDVE